MYTHQFQKEALYTLTNNRNKSPVSIWRLTILGGGGYLIGVLNIRTSYWLVVVWLPNYENEL